MPDSEVYVEMHVIVRRETRDLIRRVVEERNRQAGRSVCSPQKIAGLVVDRAADFERELLETLYVG